MAQQDLFIIDSLDKLKIISDPLRTKILMNLIKKEYTGQQLAELLQIPKTKIYFHLKELEKHGIIEIVKEEEKKRDYAEILSFDRPKIYSKRRPASEPRVD
ncbi:winged helix-turn-helix domain-containing protein [Paenibacillus thiaminolyticus]|nr:winged helix-turn-helix domain-containing protein [Paenibacillus thiaminolyticus]